MLPSFLKKTSLIFSLQTGEPFGNDLLLNVPFVFRHVADLSVHPKSQGGENKDRIDAILDIELI